MAQRIPGVHDHVDGHRRDDRGGALVELAPGDRRDARAIAWIAVALAVPMLWDALNGLVLQLLSSQYADSPTWASLIPKSPIESPSVLARDR